ncbi:MAG: glycosyltransferase [Deltaproteobacteria bacterium]|nr:glycosyltransferase [Deltaproteobacteria bacterium]
MGKDKQSLLQEDDTLFDHKHGETKIEQSVRSRLAGLSQYRESIAAYNRRRASGPLKIAVYVAITNNYDSIKLPEELNPNLDYVLFSDRPVADTGVYQVRPIAYFNADPVRAARFVKTHPHLLLKDYDLAVWVDSNIMLLGDLSPLIEDFIASGKVMASNPHPCRQTVYEEAQICSKFRNDSLAIIRKQVKSYKRAGFTHNNLSETNVMMFDLRHEATRRFLDLWWTEMERNSKRDQLSFNYCAAELGLEWHRITGGETPVLNHPNFALMVHDHGKGPAQKLVDALAHGHIDPNRGPSFGQHREARIRAQKDRAIDIIVCVHNALDDVRLCLESVQSNRTGDNQKLILIDDGSDRDTADYLEQFARDRQWASLRRNERALGFTFAANQGLRASSGDLAILLNSDTMVTDGWAEKMADAVFTTPGAGIVGPLSNAASNQSITQIAASKDQTAINPLPNGLGPEDLNRYCEQWATLDLLPMVPLVHGFCIGITRQTMDRVGLFNESDFPGGYGVEDDYCFKATDCGVQMVVASHTYVYHAKSKSYSNDQRVALMQTGSKVFFQKYGSERIGRAVASMQKNPLLQKIRSRTAELYHKINAA